MSNRPSPRREDNRIDDESIGELRESYKKFGPLHKVIETPFGIAGGNNRLKADPNWPRTFLKVSSRYEHLKLVTLDNLSRQKSGNWWRKRINEAAKELVMQGLKKGEISKKLCDDFPLGERRIFRYLNDEFKSKKGPQSVLTNVNTMDRKRDPASHNQQPLLDPNCSSCKKSLEITERGLIRCYACKKTHTWPCESCGGLTIFDILSYRLECSVCEWTRGFSGRILLPMNEEYRNEAMWDYIDNDFKDPRLESTVYSVYTGDEEPMRKRFYEIAESAKETILEAQIADVRRKSRYYPPRRSEN